MLKQECGELHPWKLTWNLKVTPLKRKIIFQISILGFHVNFRGCKSCECHDEKPLGGAYVVAGFLFIKLISFPVRSHRHHRSSWWKSVETKTIQDQTCEIVMEAMEILLVFWRWMDTPSHHLYIYIIWSKMDAHKKIRICFDLKHFNKMVVGSSVHDFFVHPTYPTYPTFASPNFMWPFFTYHVGM